MKISIQKILASALLVVFGILLILGGLKFHSSILDSYDCKTCSVFDEECVDGFYSEENQMCLYALEWPFKFSLVPIFIGVGTLGIAIIILIDGYRSKKND